jgi:hypothetical protein
MFDCTDVDDQIKMGEGTFIKAVKVGIKNVLVKQPDGSMVNVTILNCNYVPGFWVNLFSVTQTLKNGWKLSNKGLVLQIQKGANRIVFNQIMDTDSGAITGVIFEPVINVCLPPAAISPTNAAAPLSPPVPVPVQAVVQRDVNALHHIFGHVNYDSTKRTVEYYGIKCVGDIGTCADCALAKIKQKHVPKSTTSRGDLPGYRLFVDISSSMDSSFGGSMYWVLIMDDFSQYHWSYFLRQKSGLGVVMVTVLHLLKTLHNGVVERAFATLYGVVCSMLNSAKVPLVLHHGVWPEAACTATELKNLLVTHPSDKSPYEKFHGKLSDRVPYLKTFGEMAVVEMFRLVACAQNLKIMVNL